MGSWRAWAAAVFLALALWCLWKKGPAWWTPDVKVAVDPSQGMTVKPQEVDFTPRPTAARRHPTPVVYWKPLESEPTLGPGGILRIPFSGFHLVPQAGGAYVLGRGWRGYVGCRYFFWGLHDPKNPAKRGWDLGLEAGLGLDCGFLGVDVRDPLLNLLTTSAGAAFPWESPEAPSPYVGESISLAF